MSGGSGTLESLPVRRRRLPGTCAPTSACTGTQRRSPQRRKKAWPKPPRRRAQGRGVGAGRGGRERRALSIRSSPTQRPHFDPIPVFIGPVAGWKGPVLGREAHAGGDRGAACRRQGLFRREAERDRRRKLRRAASRARRRCSRERFERRARHGVTRSRLKHVVAARSRTNRPRRPAAGDKTGKAAKAVKAKTASRSRRPTRATDAVLRGFAEGETKRSFHISGFSTFASSMTFIIVLHNALVWPGSGQARAVSRRACL